MNKEKVFDTVLTMLATTITMLMLVASCWIFSSCSSEHPLVEENYFDRAAYIKECETALDSIATKFPFSDTVVGTDPYDDLCHARQGFEQAKTPQDKIKYFSQYMVNFNIVWDMCLEIIENRKK